MDDHTDRGGAQAATTRKLTTIFSADVQGYSQLMQVDEEGTLATLKEYRDAMARLIEAYQGRVVNTWGDGLIAEFASVVKAVQAAVDVQNELANRNAGRGDGVRMLFRIGLNLGDVIVEGDDIYGDGVNIAARLQAEAPPGGILISNTVYDQVRNKVAVGFEFLGNLDVKNISEGVPSYAVRIGVSQGDAAPETSSPERKPVPFGRSGGHAAGKPSFHGLPVNRQIAILAVVSAALVAINLITSPDSFWAKWWLFGFAMYGGLAWARGTSRADSFSAGLAVVGIGLVAINLMTWGGYFWAIWPLLGLSVTAGIRWVIRRTA